MKNDIYTDIKGTVDRGSTLPRFYGPNSSVHSYRMQNCTLLQARVHIKQRLWHILGMVWNFLAVICKCKLLFVVCFDNSYWWGFSYFFFLQGDLVAIKYLDRQTATDVRKPSIIEEFKVVSILFLFKVLILHAANVIDMTC